MERNKFTAEEVKELKSAIKKNPSNLQKIFRELSQKWGTHSTDSICNYYYINLRKTEACFLTVGEKKAFLNRKIVPEGMPEESYKVRKSLWEKLKNLFSK
nr:MAG TPA: TRF2-INTERACTING TELOMERIC RAP1 PROTEIN TURN HELIX, RIKEN Structural [Caudoviricetes sp.]